MSIAFGTLLVCVMTAVACTIPGSFLVLRRQSMLSDAMSHGLLPGIVIAAMIVGTIDSPLLIIGAAAMGLVVVVGAQFLRSTGLIAGDGDQGLLFPLLFSIGVILISTRYKSVHLHEDAVLVGDPNYAAFIHLETANFDFGPTYFYVLLGITLLNLVFLLFTWKQMQISTFDPLLAKSMGIPIGILNYVFMFMVAITLTASFNSAGAILVVAFMIVPGATARLLTHRLLPLLFIAVAIAAGGAIAGFYIAYVFNTSTTATMALIYGGFFLLVYYGGRLRLKLVSARSASVRAATRAA